jgi:hypothetical protein
VRSCSRTTTEGSGTLDITSLDMSQSASQAGTNVVGVRSAKPTLGSILRGNDAETDVE